MIKYLILLFFSVNLCAGDNAEAPYQKAFKLLTTEVLDEKDFDGLLEGLVGEKRRNTGFQNQSKKFKAEEFPNLEHHYTDIDQELLETMLDKLKVLGSKKSSTLSYQLTTEQCRRKAFVEMENSEVSAFIPLFKKLIETIEYIEANRSLKVQHIAIRVDPNMKFFDGQVRDRLASSEWHIHPDAGRYLFVLSEDWQAATMVKVGITPMHIDKNRLFFMPGEMLHRTPPNCHGRRIQLAIGLIKIADCPQSTEQPAR